MTEDSTARSLVHNLDTESLAGLDVRQWDELADNAADPNPFYARSYVLAGLATIDRDTRLRAVSIHHPDEQRLIGLFPFRLRRLPFETAVGATNLYQMSGQPLVHRDHAELAVRCWIDAMQDGRIPKRWRFARLDLSSRFAQLCNELTGHRAFDLVPLSPYPRARLTRLAGGFDAHLGSVLSRSRVKDIQRTLRRLEEAGELGFERATESVLVAGRIEDFLVMEHGGWKGRARTSFLSVPSHAEFMRRALSDNCATSVDSLLLDGKPIAISVNLRSGETLFTPKCAYDETYRRFSPGLVLEYLVIQAFYAGGDAREMDAATTVGGHLVQGLWNEEKTMAVALVGPDDWRTRLMARAHMALAAVHAGAKRVVGGRTWTMARRIYKAVPDVVRRLATWGQGVGVLILSV